MPVMFQLDWWLISRLGYFRTPLIVARFKRKLTTWESIQLWTIEKLMDLIQYPRSIVMLYRLNKRLKALRKDIGKKTKDLEKILKKELET